MEPDEVEGQGPATAEDEGSEELSPEFWKAPEGALGEDPTFSLIHAQVIARLKAELLTDDTLELMLIERVAFLYCHIRYKESKKLFAHDRAYKETLQLWVGLAADLRKFRKDGQGVEELRDSIFTAVKDATAKAVATLPPEVRKDFTETYLAELSEAGL